MYVSLSATKAIANKKATSFLNDLLSATDSLPIRRECKLWIYRNYIISLLRFCFCEDAITNCTIKKLESIVTHYLKKWLHLPRSATRVILYYPGICYPSVSHISREEKLSLLSCISTSSDSRLQELGLHVHLGNDLLQLQIIPSYLLHKIKSLLCHQHGPYIRRPKTNYLSLLS